jgi:hypothetical protein
MSGALAGSCHGGKRDNRYQSVVIGLKKFLSKYPTLTRHRILTTWRAALFDERFA